jgi:hypothetical protein
LEKYLGLPFVLEGEGLPAQPVPIYWLRIVLNAEEIIWLMKVCADTGARTDLLFLDSVLARIGCGPLNSAGGPRIGCSYLKTENLKMHPILKALGFETLPGPENETLKKVLNDNLVTLRAQELMVEHFAAQAIQQMHASERANLIKKITPPPAHKHLVSWIVQGGIHTGKTQIVGRCGRCGGDCFFDGKPEFAPGVIWSHCLLGPSKIPESVIEEYKDRFNYVS